MIRSAIPHSLRNAAPFRGLPQTQSFIRTNPGRHASQFISLHTRPQSTASTSSRSWTRLGVKRTRPHGRNYSSDKPPAPDVTSQLGSPAPKPGLSDKLKELFKKYGYLSVGVYLALSALDFPFCFLAVRLAGPERIGQIEHKILSTLEVYAKPVWEPIEPVVGPAVHAIRDAASRLWTGAANTAGYGASDSVQKGETVLQQAKSSSAEAASIWTQLALAYGIHKTLLIFVRVPLTAALTPRIARALRKRGWRFGSSSVN